MQTRHNKFNTEWRYADDCWKALRSGLPIPPVPKYQIFEVFENTGKTRLIKELPIEPMKITYNGNVYFG